MTIDEAYAAYGAAQDKSADLTVSFMRLYQEHGSAPYKRVPLFVPPLRNMAAALRAEAAAAEALATAITAHFGTPRPAHVTVSD